MKILAITQSKDILGGANRSFLDVLSSLRDDFNHEIDVIVPGEGDFTKAISEKGFLYRVMPYKQTSSMRYGNWKSLASMLITIKECMGNKRIANQFKSILQKNKYDIAYINDTTNSVGYYLAKALDIPYVWHFRGYNKNIVSYMPIWDEIKFRKDLHGKVIVISNAMKEFMIQHRKLQERNLVVVYNGVKANSTRRKDNLFSNGNEMHCLQCGHISLAKGQIDAVNALGILIQKGFSDIFLHLAGTPSVSHGISYQSVLEERIAALGIEKYVIFEGEVKDMGEIRNHMQIELMCSIAEPFGRVTVEGMQNGLIVIGANTGATPEIIDDGVTGLLYTQGDARSLATCIERVYKDHQLGEELANNAFLFSKTHFTMEQNVKEINDVLMNQFLKV